MIDVRDGLVMFGGTCVAVGMALWLDPWAALVGIGLVLIYVAVTVGRR